MLASEMLRRLAIASFAAVLLSGCGEEPSQEQRDARLIVRESLPAKPIYAEGSLSYVKVEKTSDGEVIADGPMTNGREVRGRKPLFNRALAPGEYRLVSHQRPCPGNCAVLDSAESPTDRPADVFTDRCEATVSLDAGETLTVTVVLGQGGGCTVREG